MKTIKCDVHGITESICNDYVLLKYSCKKCTEYDSNLYVDDLDFIIDDYENDTIDFEEEL